MIILYGALALLAGFILGGLIAVVIKKNLDKQKKKDLNSLVKQAQKEADSIIKEAKISAKEEALRAKEEFERSSKERRNELQKIEERLVSKENSLDRKSENLERRLAETENREKQMRDEIEKTKAERVELGELKKQQVAELERVAGLTREEAKAQLLQQLEHTLEREQAALIHRYQEESKQELNREAMEVMINSMQRYAGDCTYERTTSIVHLPNEEMKGRIIGREGRNIRVFENATGVSVLIDDTPEAVVLSCFDPVRREIARVAMERLVTDGRIHPTRIEELVSKVATEIDNEILEAGQQAVNSLGLSGIRKSLVQTLGRLKYRFSYSQNVLKHSVEVASIMGNIASQFGIDRQKAKRAGLFHDIGKAVDHEVEGSHASIGADILRRAGEDEFVVNAVAAHHEETEKTSLLANLVMICDTLSAGRPGARAETTELYLKRLSQMEEIGKSFAGVDSCYAVQAGRELRVIVEPTKMSEEQAQILARQMANKIEEEMRYPGQIKVTIIRETRAIEYAK